MVLLDSTVLIDVLRGHAPAVDWLGALDEVPCCSEISRIEILVGLRTHDRSRTEALLASLSWVALDETVSRRAGELGREYWNSHRLAVADLVIAATALTTDADLATSNVRHYPMFEGLRPPYE